MTTPQEAGWEKHTTVFAMKQLNELRTMLNGSDYTKVRKVADNWKWINKSLVGGADGGLKKEFDKAVDEVLEHWTGAAADGFRKRAKSISDMITVAADYAKLTATPMDNIATVLFNGKEALDAVNDPSLVDRGKDKVGNDVVSTLTFGLKGGRDDSGANADIAAGVPAEQVLKKHATELSEGRERALKAAIALEYVGAGYRTYAKQIPNPPTDRGGDYPRPEGYDGSGGGVPPVVPFPGGSGGGPKGLTPQSTPTGDVAGYGGQSAPTTPRPDGIAGGVGNAGNQPGAQISTGLNGVSGGVGTGGGPGSGLGTPGGVSTTGVTSAGGSGGVGPVGGVGLPGGGLGGTKGAGRGVGAGGRMGAPGIGGTPGAGTGAKNKKGGSGRGALAKQRGGVVGAAGSGAARAQGGSGLHRSRGGAQKGKPTTRTGMAGAPGTRGASGKDDKERKERPDYLVEDEETWVPKKNVAPRVVD